MYQKLSRGHPVRSVKNRQYRRIEQKSVGAHVRAAPCFLTRSARAYRRPALGRRTVLPHRPVFLLPACERPPAAAGFLFYGSPPMMSANTRPMRVIMDKTRALTIVKNRIRSGAQLAFFISSALFRWHIYPMTVHRKSTKRRAEHRSARPNA